MPRFYIDTSDGDVFIRDETGYEFADFAVAKSEAIAALPEMAKDALLDGDAQAFLAIVREEDGRALLQASLSFCATSLVPASAR